MTETISPLWSQYATKITYTYADTVYRNGTSGDTPTMGGPADAPEYGIGAQIEATTGMYFSSSYDKTKLDNYVVNSFKIRFTVAARGLVEDVELVFLPESWYYLSAQSKFNAIKSAALLAKTGTARAENDVVEIEITDTAIMKLVLTNGIGWRKTSGTLSSIVFPIYIDIDYGDAIFSATLTIVSPKNVIIVGNDDNAFAWTVTDNTLPQTHYDLQYSNDNGETWTTAANKVESTTTSHTITGGTLATGNYLWRVRVYGNAGTEYTNWAQAAFTVINNASTSGVSCDGKPMPTVTWTASDQAAYQVKIGDDYDSGTVYSTTGSHRPARYFADNAYAITVRTQTSLGVWSAWTEPLYVNIANTPGADILLSTYQSGYGVGLTWVTDGNYSNYYVLRDGVPIGVTASATFTDALANGAHTYSILAPRSGGNYTMSNDSLQNISLPFDIISTVDKLEWLPLKYALGNPVTRDYSESNEISYRRFAGRKRLVPFISDYELDKVSLKYGFKLLAEAEAIRKLRKKVVVFKDRRGNRLIGTIDNINRSVGKYIDLSMSITQVDYNEEVAYDTNYPAS